MISSVEFDSRLVTTDSLFVPLAGTRDGHEFAQQAQEKGAIAAFGAIRQSSRQKD